MPHTLMLLIQLIGKIFKIEIEHTFKDIDKKLKLLSASGLTPLELII